MEEQRSAITLAQLHDEIRHMTKEAETHHNESIRLTQVGIRFTAYAICVAVVFLGISLITPMLSPYSWIINGAGLIAIGIGGGTYCWLTIRRLARR